MPFYPIKDAEPKQGVEEFRHTIRASTVTTCVLDDALFFVSVVKQKAIAWSLHGSITSSVRHEREASTITTTTLAFPRFSLCINGLKDLFYPPGDGVTTP